MITLVKHSYFRAGSEFHLHVLCLNAVSVCLVGLVWIASVIVGSPMLFVQQLEVSAVPLHFISLSPLTEKAILRS